MAIVQRTPELDLVSEIYAEIDTQGVPPALLSRTVFLLARPHTGTYRTCITLGSILIGMAVACAGFLADNVVMLICAALAFVVTAVAYGLWEVQWT